MLSTDSRPAAPPSLPTRDHGPTGPTDPPLLLAQAGTVSPLRSDRAFRVFVAVAIALAAVYYGVFVFKTSFLVNGERYFCLYDDAMISMRYAKNLAQGLDSSGTPGASALKGLRIPYGFSSWPDYMSPRSRRPR